MSDSEDDLELLALLRLRRKLNRPREFGEHPLRRDKQHGHYKALFKALDDDREFRKYARMSRATFEDLLRRVKPR